MNDFRQFFTIAGMEDFDIRTFPVNLPEPEIFTTGWNRLLDRTGDVQIRRDMLQPLPEVRILASGNVSSKVRITTKSWFFILPPDKGRGNADSALDDQTMLNGENQLSAREEHTHENHHEEYADAGHEELTRIKVPRDAVKIQDRLNYILQPPIESFLNLPNLEMPFEPFPYQRQGIAFLYSAHFAILADEMGLGKTMQAITTIRLLLRTGEIRNVLLICPKPLISNWRREFALWAPEISVHIIDGSPARRKWLWQLPNLPVRLANYELLSRDREFFDHTLTDECIKFDLVVLDESQRIKNQWNATSAAARAISRRRNWALTGTPVENSQEDIVGIFEFLSPGFLESGLEPERICSIVGEHILRRTKDKVLTQLPPKMIDDVFLELLPEQAETYRLAENEGVLRLSAEGEEITNMHVLELVVRLKQICNFDPATGQSAKLERLLADLEEVAASGRKAIVFSQWVETLYRLKDELNRFGISEYHGKIPQNKRDEMIRLFREDKNIHVILMSYGAGSVGLNLQFANYVFLFDRWWNPAIEDQAINRAHRIGASGPITVKRFITSSTVEERINQTLEQKRQLAELILSGARGLNSSRGLNQEELFGLFNLKVPEKLRKAA
ncbi:MAG: DEAD/DEAH box helicase [Planctomycetaceae bacterium]|nr:DEAD/DEAH box helicase [Planctomycetaceae bacterium]